jgi:CxxC motif-containing protein (DUF1111 family)
LRKQGVGLAVVVFGFAAACGKVASERGHGAPSAVGGAGASLSSGAGGAAPGEAGGAEPLGGDADQPTAGATGEAGSAGDSTACSSPAFGYEPLFVVTAASSLAPIAYTDPVTKHLIFRGAGRVRMRHEMESDYATYPSYYFEGRTFGYILDDSIPAGGSTIGVTFLPSGNQYYSKQALAGGQQGGQDLALHFWKLYGAYDGNAFAGNAGGAQNNVLPFGCLADPNGPSCDTRKYTFTITQNDREHRPIQIGDQLQIEFTPDLARYGSGLGPPADLTHVRNFVPLPSGCVASGSPYDNNCYTQANYYADSLRYVVGSGVLTPYNEDCTLTVPPGDEAAYPQPFDCSPAGPIAQAVAAGTLSDRTGPAEAGWSAGTATLPYLRQHHDLYFSQMAPNILQENAESFVQGRRLFETDFTTGEDVEPRNALTAPELALHAGRAGPLFNRTTCEGCHGRNNRGVAPAAGVALDAVVVKLFGAGMDAHGGPMPDASYGFQLQTQALAGSTVEGSAAFSYAAAQGKLADGTTYTLHQPTTVLSNLSQGQPAAFSARMASPLIGLGLLEAISEQSILAAADPNDCDHDGISGVPNLVFDAADGKMHVGRFGWKATSASLRAQLASDLSLNLGVTSSVLPKHDCGSAEAACLAADGNAPELTDDDLSRLVTYLRELAVPARRDVSLAPVARGAALFTSLGCAACHSPSAHTADTHPFLELRGLDIHPYTDLLLHDMGEGLADAHGQRESSASPSEWRTPPLWGIGVCDEVAAGSPQNGDAPSPNFGPCQYLHDGRAATLLEAILWHGGEAQAARDRVVALASDERTALLAFLGSL